ncbi:MAG: fimbria/pilus outer membrane usher protein [Gammaproteobacteria bacterium]|nr:fimbria/pilus outer membrane usher protein [Gammaproteobacteria bacterium]
MRWRLRNNFLGLILALVSGTASGEYIVLLAEVELNDVYKGQRILLWDGGAEYYAEASDLEEWRIRRPYAEAVIHRGKSYHPLLSFPGIRVQYEPLTVSLQLTLPISLFEPQIYSSRRESPQASAGNGAFLDYDWSYTEGPASALTGYMAPTLFSAKGSLHSDFLYRQTAGNSDLQSPADGWVRLNTRYSLDDPDAMRRYEVGDVITTPGPWGGWLRMGGVQVATNFGTRPYQNIHPSLTMGGDAGMPAAVDLYVNGQLRRHEEVESGAFSIEDIPVINGDGQIQMVMTDVLGRQQIFTQSYYASNDLLSQGLHDYSYTLGALRKNYAYESNNYAETAFIGMHRYGVSNALTLGGRFEASDERLLGAAEAAWLAGRSGVMNGNLAVSDANAGAGALWGLGYEYRGGLFSLGGQIAGSTAKFTTVAVSGATPELQFVLNGSISAGYKGTFGMSYVHQAFHDTVLRDDTDVLTISHNRGFLWDFFLSIRASLISSGDTDYSIGMMLTRAFGNRQSTSTSADFSENSSRVRVETRSSVPYGPGYGYHVGATLGDDERLDGSVTGQTQYGRYQLDASHYGGQNYWRAGTDGSVAWMAGRPYFSREIHSGFAVAKVGEFENVRVYVENQEVGRTDAHGRVLLPGLRPFEKNRISLESADLPLHVRINTTRTSASPYAGTGTLVEFSLDASRSLMLHAIQTSGKPVPMGALATIEGRDEPLLVGLNGMMYVSGMHQPQLARVAWHGGACNLVVPMPDSQHPLPNIGEVTCENE